MITLPNGNSIDLDMLETAVLATCGIRPPVETFENTPSRLLLLADSPGEE